MSRYNLCFTQKVRFPTFPYFISFKTVNRFGYFTKTGLLLATPSTRNSQAHLIIVCGIAYPPSFDKSLPVMRTKLTNEYDFGVSNHSLKLLSVPHFLSKDYNRYKSFSGHVMQNFLED